MAPRITQYRQSERQNRPPGVDLMRARKFAAAQVKFEQAIRLVLNKSTVELIWLDRLWQFLFF
jgi:hypothetical protein